MIIIVWIIQLSAMAGFDTRKSLFNLILNITVLITSAIMTYFWGNIYWLAVPLIAIPIIAGLIGGIIKGFYLKSKDK